MVKRADSSPPSVHVRRAAGADHAALVALENRVFASERMAPRQWRRHLASASAEVLVATRSGTARSGTVIGAALVFFRAGSGVARLYSIAVAEQARGLGVGAALLAAAERAARHRHATRMLLEVRSDNRVAQRLYERHGYHRFALLRGYYEDGHDALRYRRILDVSS